VGKGEVYEKRLGRAFGKAVLRSEGKQGYLNPSDKR
jgi:hypothetical protein